MTEFIKVTVMVPESDLTLVKALAVRRQTTVTNIIRCALRTEVYLSDKLRENTKVILRHADGTSESLKYRRN